MTTRFNIFGVPTYWADRDLSVNTLNEPLHENAPPAAEWDSGLGKYIFDAVPNTTTGGPSAVGMRYTLQIADTGAGENAHGQAVAFKVVSPTLAGATIRYWNSTSDDGSGYLLKADTPDFEQLLAPGVEYTFTSPKLSSTDGAPYLEISVDDGSGNDLHVEMTPIEIVLKPVVNITLDQFGRTTYIHPNLQDVDPSTGIDSTTGETVTRLEFDYGDGSPLDGGINDDAAGVTHPELDFYGAHRYTADGSYTAKVRVYTVEAGATPYEYTIDFTAAADAVTEGLFSSTANGLDATITDSSPYYNDGDATKTVTNRVWFLYNFDGTQLASITDNGAGGPAPAALNYTFPEAGTYSVVLESVANDGAGTDHFISYLSTVTVADLPPPDNGGGDGGDGGTPTNVYAMKGFVVYPDLANNTPNNVAPVGELSAWSSTYSSESQLYRLHAGAGPAYRSQIVTFKSTDDSGSIEMPQTYGDQSVVVANWIYSQATGGAFTADSVAFGTALQTYFTGLIENLKVGAMVKSGEFWFPSWIEFRVIAQAEGFADNLIRLWFSDADFRVQYNEYELRVVPPVVALDDFFQSLNTVQTDAAQFDLAERDSRVQNVANGQPYTTVRSYSFDYVSSGAQVIRIPFWWTVIQYGVAGDNLDAIKAALVTYILANSTHSRDEWSQIFPDIFQVTEFILTPRWDDYAIPNQTMKPGIYSPTLNYLNTLEVAKGTALGVGYTPAQIQARLNIVPLQYKSMVMLAVGGPLNKTEQATFQQVFPDYINVPSTSVDNNRMSVRTQNFLTLLNQMLDAAENMTQYSVLPGTLMRVFRNNVMYVMGTYQTIQYLMVSRSSMYDMFGIGVVGSTDSISGI